MWILYFTSSKEIRKACEKKMPYDFTYFILICKLYKSEKPQTKKKKKKQQHSGGGDEPEIVWSNPEEEIINQVCGTSLERVLCCAETVL
jgi:protein BCP1